MLHLQAQMQAQHQLQIQQMQMQMQTQQQLFSSQPAFSASFGPSQYPPQPFQQTSYSPQTFPLQLTPPPAPQCGLPSNLLSKPTTSPEDTSICAATRELLIANSAVYRSRKPDGGLSQADAKALSSQLDTY